jgi:uncharacterized protein (TIGR00251 family)
LIVLAVRVHPGAGRDGLTVLDDGSLDVRLRARAIDGKANKALVELLADRLGMRHREVEIVRGARARQKLVRVTLQSRDEALRRLGATP